MNESTESAIFAFLLGWMRWNPRIYNNFEFKQLTQENALMCLDKIKSMSEIIRVLSTYDLNVIKRINLEMRLYDGRIKTAEIIYLRKFLGNYKMRQKEVISEKERFDRLLNGIPEEEYPSDLLDEYILKAVQTKFADVKIKSSTMLMSTDLRELQKYRNICCNPTSIIIEPGLSAIPEQILYSLNRLKIITIPIQIYEDCTIGGNLLTTLPLLFLFHLMIISTTLLR